MLENAEHAEGRRLRQLTTDNELNEPPLHPRTHTSSKQRLQIFQYFAQLEQSYVVYDRLIYTVLRS